MGAPAGQNCGTCYFSQNQTQVQNSTPVTVLTCRYNAPEQVVSPLNFGTAVLPAVWPQVDQFDGWCGYWAANNRPPFRNCGNCFFLQNQTQVQNNQPVTVPTCRFTVPKRIVPPAAQNRGTDALPAFWPQVDLLDGWCGQWISSGSPRGPTWRQPANVNKAIKVSWDFTGNAGAGGTPGNVNYIINTLAALTEATPGDIYLFGSNAAQSSSGNPYLYLLMNTDVAQPTPTTSVGQWPSAPGDWVVVIASTTVSGGSGGGDGGGGAGGGDGGGDD